MAVAGKVAITLSTENGGAWSADVTYDRLVAVKHNNNLYISRKTVANVEPPNDDFWFLALEGFGGDDVEDIINGTTQVGNAKTLDGHGAEYFAEKTALLNYLKYDGSNGWVNSVADLNTFYTGITLTNSSENMPDDDWWLVLAGGASGTTVQLAYNLWASRVPRIRYCAAGVWSEWYDINKEYLPLSGGTLSGIDNILNLLSSSENAWIYFNTSDGRKASVGYYGGISSVANDLTGARIGVTDDGTPQYWKDANGTSRLDLLHTGNKPTGTYTGNGSSEKRQIAVNAGGYCALLVHNDNGFMIVSTKGAIGIESGGTVRTLPYNKAQFWGTNLEMWTDDNILNASGKVSYWMVL